MKREFDLTSFLTDRLIDTSIQEKFNTTRNFHSVKEKLKQLDLGPKPYYLPVFGNGTPVWRHPSILVSYGGLPNKKSRLPAYDYDKTLFIIESGGYLEENEKPKSQEECINKQMRMDPDLCFTLDFPVKQKNARKGYGAIERKKATSISEPEKKRLLELTINNARYCMKSRERVSEIWNYQFEPMAVLHGHNKQAMTYCAEELYSCGYDFYAMGTIPTDSAIRHTPSIVAQAELIRDVIGPKPWVHLLGVTDVEILNSINITSNNQMFGSSSNQEEVNQEMSTLSQTKELITSFDSASLTWYAAYAMLILPNGSTVRLGDHGGYRDPKWGHFYPVKSEDYIKLQLENFKNFIELLHREFWRDRIGSDE